MIARPVPRRAPWTARLLQLAAPIAPHERTAVTLAFACNFALLGSYYVLRPIRDTVATVVGVNQLQTLFTATFVGSLLVSPVYAWLASRLRLSRLLPGVFWFWLANVLLFQVLFQLAPASLWVAAAYYIWFSIANLFMISVFWSLMVDLFTAAQATRLFSLIAAGGSIGAIVGPLLTRLLVGRLGLPGLLLLAASGFAIVIALVYRLMAEKRRLRESHQEVQASSLEHGLAGNPFDGFSRLFSSRYVLAQAGFILLMSWVNTVAYFFQTDLVARSFAALWARAAALADIDLAVNICTALILFFGLGRLMRSFGVRAALVLNPLLMIGAFAAVLLAPALITIQAIQVVRRVAQYAIARPAREVCFTVVEQDSRYKTKNVIDTVVYRFGDLSSAWMQTG
ncbi:MAG: NTP/NDP exchange transporter, partial [Steroidobacteraceae bacterium]